MAERVHVVDGGKLCKLRVCPCSCTDRTTCSVRYVVHL